MKKLLLLAILTTFAGCDSNITISIPQNHWNYGIIGETVTRCELITYGDAQNDGTYRHEFRLCSGTFNTFTETGEGNYLYFKLGTQAEELADGVYYLDGGSHGSLTETGYADRTASGAVLFTAGSVEIRKSGEKYRITFSLKDEDGIVMNGYYSGTFEFSDLTPEPGKPVEASVYQENSAEFLSLDEVRAVSSDGVVLATGIFSDGGFSVMLPVSVDPSLLTDPHDEGVWSPGLTFSSGPGTVKQSPYVNFHAYSSDEKKGEFILQAAAADKYADNYIYYVYFDGDLTIKGTFEECGMECIYDLTFTKGWNRVWHYVPKGSLTQYVTTEIPQTEWRYDSDSY